MVGHVKAEHLLLECQPGCLVELDVGDHGPLVELRPGGALAEQRHDTHVVLLTAGNRVVDYLLVGVQEPLAGMPHCVKRSGLDERLHRPLVQDRGVATLGEIVEILERPVGGPLGLDQPHQTRSHVAHR